MATDLRTRRPASGLDGFFKISERGSTLSRELRGGVVTFFTMAYIIVLNPIILSGVADGSGNFIGGTTDLAESKLLVAVGTAVVAGVMSILMGVVGRFPIAIAAGLGINALITGMVVTHASEGITFADLMGLVVIEGVIILVLVLTGFRRAVFRAIPAPLKVAISVGIGLFIAFIGVIDAGFARRPSTPGSVPSELGIGGSLDGWPTVVFVVGVLLMAVLLIRKVKGAILIGIVVATALAIAIEAVAKIGPRTFGADGALVNPDAWALTVPALPTSITNTPDLGILGQFSLLGSFGKIGVITATLFVFSLLLADFFDTMGTVVAIGTEAKLLDEHGNPPNTDRILAVDSVAAIAGGAGGVSSNTSYIESAAGVGEGARTGLASVVTGILFLLATFLAPLFAIVPSEAAAPALVIVGYLMMTQVTNISWDDMEVGIPAFLTIVLMPFTYNITVGIGAGFIAWVLLKVARGKTRSIHPLLWIVTAFFLVYFAKAPIESLLTGA
ncbi:AGZA family xanthine/uracil permease-like MFS transporter [Terracoccus luteus]|uniref:AGZA family xanthine/uracil permease-like MFS transporter n=1 Tax=Terracoccus luteus TaxID=53356 RepID=A0A495Y3J8_9MICO|nr:NCS2 family permease [Terracoccus luteus]RKT78828.1 AGZA family xanthine/uracil permease-like MFS transporter [Terracoccus luteus]